MRVEITGACGGAWQIRKERSAWVWAPHSARLDAVAIVPEEIAWLVFTRGMGPDEAALQVRLQGDNFTASRVLQMTSVVA
jgi:hypothetical protein